MKLLADQIQAVLKCQKTTAEILFARGFDTQEKLDRFLKPELAKLPDPFKITGIPAAVERVVEAIANEEPIAIYGDYDVDGTCGSALLFDFFKKCSVDVTTYQPDRFSEGYGVHVAAIEKLIADGARVIITVDCGITAVEPARVCREAGVDLIILDHHKQGEVLPDACAIVNPQLQLDAIFDDENESLARVKNLCGTGVAFFFTIAMRTALREVGYFEERELAEPNMKSFMDLVAVATIADMMDVRGVNRILLTFGMQVLQQKPRTGFKALLQEAAVKKPTAMHCGFILGPRINAAGRLKHAKAALDLLLTENMNEAVAMAKELEIVNTERKALQEKVVVEAIEQAALKIATSPKALVLFNEHWHEGVLGIAASRVVEEYIRPVVILSVKEGCTVPTVKGSVRSLSKIDILAAISAESVAKHLLNFGGHAHAGGVTLLQSKIEDFSKALNDELARTTTPDQYLREKKFDAVIGLNEINAKLVEELESIGPYGQGFFEPTLKVTNTPTANVRVLKDKHLKLSLTPLKSVETAFAPPQVFDAVWFNSIRAIEVNRLEKGEPCNFWVKPEFNEWQGTKRLQLRITHAEF